VTRVNVAARRGWAHAGRWLARALLVVGAALAGTVVAWAISDATASADPMTDPTEITGQLAQGLSRLAGAQTPLGLRLAPSSEDEIHQRIAGDVRGTMASVAGDAVLHPVEGLLGSVEPIAWQPRNIRIPLVLDTTLAPPRTLPGVADSTGQLVKVAASPAEVLPSRRLAAPETTSGSAVPVITVPPVPGSHGTVPMRIRAQTRDLLPQPGPSAPLRELPVPADLPAVPNGSASGDHVDGPLFSVPSWILITAPADVTRAISFGTSHLPAQPGTQPGVTPD
jgi:hypothetical protein